jgi:hypothetical protein
MINQQLLDFIRKQLQEGVEKNKITNDLLTNGWVVGDIEEAFRTINIGVPAPEHLDRIAADHLSAHSKFRDRIIKISIFLVYILCFLTYLFYVVDFDTLKYGLSFSIYNSMEFFVFGGIAIFFLLDLIFLHVVIKTFFKKKKIAFLWLSIFIILNLITGFIVGLVGAISQTADKPVIYLYPTTVEKVQVKLDYNGNIIADYPSYDPIQKGWTVTAYPDGKIINSDGKEYSYLFWEGEPYKNPNYDLSTGFVVKGEDTVKFLQEKLSQFGLTPKEFNEFIVYWYPKMKNNKYNLIHFAGKEYTDLAPIVITPKPDSDLRVFMVYKPLNKMIEVTPQEIKPFTRHGFTVVEWGGTELPK